jgi:hypothetical protein
MLDQFCIRNNKTAVKCNPATAIRRWEQRVLQVLQTANACAIEINNDMIKEAERLTDDDDGHS